MPYPDHSPMFRHPDLLTTPLDDLQARHRELAGRMTQGRHQAHLRAELVRIELELTKREAGKGSETLPL